MLPGDDFNKSPCPPTTASFERPRAAINAGHLYDMEVRELRDCANLLEVHVAEETPNVHVFGAIHSLVIRFADLRGVPAEHRSQVDAALVDIRDFAFK